MTSVLGFCLLMDSFFGGGAAFSLHSLKYMSVSFPLQARDEFNNVQVYDPFSGPDAFAAQFDEISGSVSLLVSPKNNEDGTYLFSLSATRSGTYSLTVTLGADEVQTYSNIVVAPATTMTDRFVCMYCLYFLFEREYWERLRGLFARSWLTRRCNVRQICVHLPQLCRCEPNTSVRLCFSEVSTSIYLRVCYVYSRKLETHSHIKHDTHAHTQVHRHRRVLLRHSTSGRNAHATYQRTRHIQQLGA